MSASLMSSFFLLAQQAGTAATTGPQLPAWISHALQWFFVWGEPSVTDGAWYGALITFTKVVGLFCLIGWVGAWVITANKDRIIVRSKTDWLDIVAALALLGILASVLVGVLQTTGRMPGIRIAGVPLASALGAGFSLLLFVWVERALWTTVSVLGTLGDKAILGGMHLALILGIAIAFLFQILGAESITSARAALILGTRWGATYMGLVVLARVAWIMLFEVLSLRVRRLYAIAKLSVVEANRRMWAPWAVMAIFFVILAFTHWFLQTPDQRPAELARLYIGSTTLLISLLLTLLVAFISPISLPHDIQTQTIYTIVSKPVRRLELVWGRLFGYMALVTVLLLVFGLFTIGYIERNVNATITQTEKEAVALLTSDPLRSKQLAEQAEQLRTRMSARLPVKGSLTFLDSRKKASVQGIDVGQDSQTANLEVRSFVEGATESAAIWMYGIVPDPLDPKIPLDRRIPVDSFLTPGTVEAIENQAVVAEYAMIQVDQAATKAQGAEAAKLASTRTSMAADVQRLRAQSKALQDKVAEIDRKADAAETAGDTKNAEALRTEAAGYHSPPIPIEMTFTIYRTTKGKLGEPVNAALEVTNPRTNQPPFSRIFPIREYYTNRQYIPSSYLVGSLGSLKCEIRCISPTQYLGMAESDFFLLQDSGSFRINFLIGLFGIWLQAMVLTAIGVFASTFLSWPVALLTTVFFFISGQVAFVFLQEFALQSLVGGGPAESLIRLVTHDNQMSDLTPTLGVIVAKTFDAMVMPIMGRLVYLVPNFSALDVTNTVADGFAVPWSKVFYNTLLAFGYAIPFSIGGYFILKNREVAA